MSKYTKWYGPKAKAAGIRATEWTVRELAELLGDDFTVFVSFGHCTNGLEGFGRDRMVRQGDMMAVMGRFEGDREDRVILRHPMDRKLRILTRPA